MRLSWIPKDVVDHQNLYWHPFGIKHRKGGGLPHLPEWETTWYWRGYWLHIVNVLHPAFWRAVCRNGWPEMRWWFKYIARAGRE